MSESNRDKKWQNQSIALAGVFQAGALAHQLATTGQCDEAAFNTSINSLYTLDAPSISAVYGGVDSLKLGIQQMVLMFARGKEKVVPDIARYALSLIMLQNKLKNHSEMMSELTKRMQHVVTQADYFSPTHENVIANLADIYLSTISTFRMRIHILGKPEYLHQANVVAKIRALFLAGIRSAVLWQQVGGRRWQLFFARQVYAKWARKLL